MASTRRAVRTLLQGVLIIAGCNKGSQGSDRGKSEQICNGERLVEGLTEAPVQLHGKQGMPTEIKKVVINSYAWQLENLLLDRPQLQLQRAARR
jgi:hypothetical protein